MAQIDTFKFVSTRAEIPYYSGLEDEDPPTVNIFVIDDATGGVERWVWTPNDTTTEDGITVMEPQLSGPVGRWKRWGFLESADWNATSGHRAIANKPTLPNLAFAAPSSRSVSIGTAYQASDTAKPAMITVNLASTAALTLAGGQSYGCDVVIGTTSGIATSGGTVVAQYRNTISGALVVGLNVNTTAATPYAISLPTGWYFALRNPGGGFTSPTVTSVLDQKVG